MKILITGAAGFIGFHLIKKILFDDNNVEIIGLDNINDYYDVRLKYERLKVNGIAEDEIKYGELVKSNVNSRYHFIKLNLEDRHNINRLFESERFDIVCNLAAQAGVRYSIENPYAYIDSNIVGFINILEGCVKFKVEHLVYASSSSVYGMNSKVPFSEDDKVDEPVSLYAATKKANELMAYSYSHLYKLPTTGLRFFTVYGPWGRPDMAPILFAQSIVQNKPIKVFNNGNLLRDFTYIDDIINGVTKVIFRKFENSNNEVPYQILNIGNSKPITLMDFISTLENAIGEKAILEMHPMQQGDVKVTYADVTKIMNKYQFIPKIKLNEGINLFVDWFKKYYIKGNI